MLRSNSPWRALHQDDRMVNVHRDFDSIPSAKLTQKLNSVRVSPCVAGGSAYLSGSRRTRTCLWPMVVMQRRNASFLAARPSKSPWAGPEREDGMVAFRSRGVVPCPDANLRGTRLRGRGNRVIDPSSLS